MQFPLRFFGLVLTTVVFFSLAETRIAHALPPPAPTPAVSPPAISPTPAAAPSSLEMIARDGGGTERHLRSHQGVVEQLSINANQTVAVTLQFPNDKVGARLTVTCLDGGEVVGGNPVVLPNGKALFTFHAGAAPGLYRVPVYVGGDQYRLEFYVIDPTRPRNPRLRPHN
ncbi:MAG: hypothetical protein V7609_1291 [Verrucomicrobiota bacterium]